MANRTLNLPITELDFERIKENLKSYLSSTDEFKDFDYEGSGINILLDLLAYNTHYSAIYANMLVSESFIDSAVLRRSLVSLAKNLGYVPNSRRAASAEIDLILGTTSGVPATIPGNKVLCQQGWGKLHILHDGAVCDRQVCHSLQGRGNNHPTGSL